MRWELGGIMRKFSCELTILLALLVAIISYGPTCELLSIDVRDFQAVSVGAKVKAESVETKTYNIEKPSKFTFTLKNVNGSIRILGEPIGEILIRAEKTAYGETQEQAEKLLKELVVYDKGKDRLDIRVKAPMVTVGGKSPKVNFTISLPETLQHVYVKSVNGSIDVRYINSSIELHTVNGGIDVDGSGDMKVSTTNGSIDIKAMHGMVRASTTNGRIDIYAKDGRVAASTTNGRIKFRLESPDGVDARTTNGSIDVDLERVENVEVKASTNKGNEIYLVGFDRVEREKGVMRKSATAILGNGRVKLKFRTVNGNIKVRIRR